MQRCVTLLVPRRYNFSRHLLAAEEFSAALGMALKRGAMQRRVTILVPRRHPRGYHWVLAHLLR